VNPRKNKNQAQSEQIEYCQQHKTCLQAAIGKWVCHTAMEYQWACHTPNIMARLKWCQESSHHESQQYDLPCKTSHWKKDTLSGLPFNKTSSIGPSRLSARTLRRKQAAYIGWADCEIVRQTNFLLQDKT
jgi:hypothetical protein